MREITVEKDGLSVTVRESIGSDVVEAPYIHAVIGEALAQRAGLNEIKSLPPRAWNSIVIVTSIIQQVVTVGGEWPFLFPDIDNNAEIVAFYDAALKEAAVYITLLKEALKKVETSPIPNA